MAIIPLSLNRQIMTYTEFINSYVYHKILHSPTYLGMYKVSKPKVCDPPAFNLYEECGSVCYVFGFTLWNTLFSCYDSFHDEPGEIFRNMGNNTEYILIGEGGIFIFSTQSLVSNVFCRCQQPIDCIYRFEGFDSELKCWNFKFSGFEHLNLPQIREFSIKPTRIDSNTFDQFAPCPEEIWEKFSLIKWYRGKPLFSGEVSISEKTRKLCNILTEKNIITAKQLENFTYNLLDDENNLKIFQVDAKLFLLDNDIDGIGTHSALYFESIPIFKHPTIQTKGSSMWLYDPEVKGYCCGHEQDFFRIVFEGKLQFHKGTVVQIESETIFIHLISKNLKNCISINANETKFKDQIKSAYTQNITVELDILYFNNGHMDKYKIFAFNLQK